MADRTSLRAAALVLLLAASCGTGEGSSQAGQQPLTTEVIAGIPVLAGATKGPGTELGDGLSVAEGSLLLGEVFPTGVAVEYSGRPIEDHGWRALLLVTGDPAAVMQAYAAQAAEIGLAVRPSSSNRDRLCADLQHRPGLTCVAEAEEGTYLDGRRITLSLLRAPQDGNRLPRSHLVVHYRVTGSPPNPAGPAEPDSDDGADEVTVNGDLPTEWPPLPGVGEPFESALDHPRAFRVRAGSQLIAHPGQGIECGGSTAVFRVDGDPADVVHAYALGKEDTDRPTRRSDDGATVFKMYGHANGLYVIEAIVRPGQPTFLLIEHCDTD